MAAGSISGSSPWILTTISAVLGGGDFGHPVRAGEMVGAGHADARAEIFRADFGHRSSSVAMIMLVRYRAWRRAFVHVLQHGFGGDAGEDFAGKTGGGEPGRNNAQDFTRHRGSYHKTPMLDLEKERLA